MTRNKGCSRVLDESRTSSALIEETLDNDVSDGESDNVSVKYEFFVDLRDPHTHVRILAKE